MKKIILIALLFSSLISLGQDKKNVFWLRFHPTSDTLNLKEGMMWRNTSIDKLVYYSGGSKRVLSTGSGSGITNSAASNELMKSDGTNAVTSGLFTSTNGNIAMGSASISGNRTLSAVNSTSDATLTVTSQSDLSLVSSASGVTVTADSEIEINAGGGSVNLELTASRATISGADYVVSSTDIVVDDDTKGIILKSPNGHYWRGTISNVGVVTWSDLGTSLP